MMRRLVSLASISLALLGVAASARAAEEGVDIRNVDLSDFPEVRLIASLGEATPDSIELQENGETVESFDVDTLSEAGEEVHVVLLLDTSGSMEGQPFATAMAAARQFIRGLPSNIGIGIVAFADSPQVVRRISSDHRGALAALARLRPRGETALYDGVRTAARLFSGPGQRNIVLLSDGADTTSRTRLAAAASAARRAGAAIFAVGLTSGEVDFEALRTLARRTKGRYASAATADLESVYRRLATELERQYVITYTSDAPPQSQLSLSVVTPTGVDTTLVLTPEPNATAKPEPAPPPRPEPEPALRGTAGLIVALGSVFLAVVALGVTGGSTLVRRRRDRHLARVLAVVPAEGGEKEASDKDEGGPISWIPKSISEAAGRVAERRGIAPELDAKLERAAWSLKPGEFLSVCMVAGLAGALVGILLLPNPLFVLLTAGIGGAIPVVLLQRKERLRAGKLQAQLPDILMILAGSLRAGHSFQQALEGAAKEVGEPGAQEFGRVVAEVRLGRRVDEALLSMAERIGSDDFKWAVIAMNIQREVGGNLAEVFDTVAHTMRERETVRRQVKVLSTEGRLSVWILATLPIGIAVYIALVNPDYLRLLFSTRIGVLMVVSSLCLLVAGIAWMRRVVTIDV